MSDMLRRIADLEDRVEQLQEERDGIAHRLADLQAVENQHREENGRLRSTIARLERRLAWVPRWSASCSCGKNSGRPDADAGSVLQWANMHGEPGGDECQASEPDVTLIKHVGDDDIM